MDNGHTPAPAKLMAALARAQAELQPAPKRGKNAFLKNEYATLDDVIGAVRGPLAAHGLGFMQLLGTNDAGATTLKTVLFHESGESVESEVQIGAWTEGKNALQALGGAITYMKRYALSALLGVATDEDTDAEGTEQGQVRTRRARPVEDNGGDGSAKCPVCRAAGDAHAPWCVEVDGGRIDNRKANGPKAAGKAPATADPDGGELDKALGRTPAGGDGDKANATERGDPPARAPQALLKLVNSRVEVGYDSIHHLTRAIKAELGDGWKPWPTFNDSDGWWTAYDAAVKHAEAKVKPEAAPAAAGDEPLPF
jgi:hypothetical protein